MTDPGPPRLISIGLPLAALAVVLGMSGFGAVVAMSGALPAGWHFALAVLSHENGAIEIATVILLLWALGVALVTARDALTAARPWIALWLALHAAGLVYFAGYEDLFVNTMMVAGTPHIQINNLILSYSAEASTTGTARTE